MIGENMPVRVLAPYVERVLRNTHSASKDSGSMRADPQGPVRAGLAGGLVGSGEETGTGVAEVLEASTKAVSVGKAVLVAAGVLVGAGVLLGVAVPVRAGVKVAVGGAVGVAVSSSRIWPP
jgi:hypothetical protein